MKKLLLFCFTILYINAFAQPRVITFESEQSSKDKILQKNALKVSLFELASGDFPIYYERVLGKKLSAEVSAGITFGDYFGGAFFESATSPFESSVSAKYGFSFSASIRFYPIEVLEEFYISPEFKYRKYNWNREADYYMEQPPYSGVQNVSESRTYAMPRISFGYVFFYDSNLSFDYYVGIGMNNPTETIFNDELLRVEEQKLNTRPRLHLGLKIGYVF